MSSCKSAFLSVKPFAFQGDVGHPDVPDTTAAGLTMAILRDVFGLNLAPVQTNVREKPVMLHYVPLLCRRKGVDINGLIFNHCFHLVLDAQSI